MSEHESEAPSAEQPIEQPAPVAPEQPQHEPDLEAEAIDRAAPDDETTDAGDGAGDQPDERELQLIEDDGDVTGDRPEQHPASAGFGVTAKFVHDELPEQPDDEQQDAGGQDAGSS